MNLPNKLTLGRIFLSIIILLLLGCPVYMFGFSWPEYLLGGKIVIKLNYIIAGILFVIASLTDMLDGKIARKYNMVTDFGKMMDAIADKVLVNGVLILLAYNHNLPVIVPVVVILRDTVVDAIKMASGAKGKVVAASKAGKVKTACMMVGLTLVLFSNIPFEFFGIGVGKGLVLLATCLSVYSGMEYYVVNKDLIFRVRIKNINVEYNTLPVTNKKVIYINSYDGNIYGGIKTEIDQNVAFFAGVRSSQGYT